MLVFLGAHKCPPLVNTWGRDPDKKEGDYRGKRDS